MINHKLIVAHLRSTWKWYVLVLILMGLGVITPECAIDGMPDFGLCKEVIQA